MFTWNIVAVIIITGIYSRHDSTTYAKPIDKGISRYELSEEELHVLNEAINSKNITFRTKYGYNITQNEILLYGKINVDDEKNKLLLESCESKIWDWTQWNHLAYSGVDYETGIVSANEANNNFLVYSMVDISKWIKYHLLMMNYPKNIIIYKVPRRR